MNEKAIIAATRRWIRDMVIGLNLCPFARRVFEADKIRYVVTDVKTQAGLLEVFAGEVALLGSGDLAGIETTLLIHPGVLGNFLDYNEFLDLAEQAIADLGMEGVLQVASFHPDYQFANTAPDDVENYTNRAPYPMLHLLREESISAVADDVDELFEIPERNIETLRSIGKERIVAMLREISEASS